MTAAVSVGRRTRPRCLGKFVISVSDLQYQCEWSALGGDGQPREGRLGFG